MSAHRIAGWLLFDVKLLGFLALVSLFVSVGVVALLLRAKQWNCYLSAAFALFCLVFAGLMLFCQHLLRYPVAVFNTYISFPAVKLSTLQEQQAAHPGVPGEYRYVAWFSLDYYVTSFIGFVSVVLVSTILLLFLRGRRWHEYIAAFVLLLIPIAGLAISICNQIFAYPVLAVERVFQYF